jgi:hypothetical protein
MYTFVSFNVGELFEKWQTPMVKLAHEIGVSDFAVAKACRKAGIPLPAWPLGQKNKGTQPKPPQVEGKVRFQLLDRDNSLATTGTDLNSPIVRRTIEPPIDYCWDVRMQWYLNWNRLGLFRRAGDQKLLLKDLH